MLFVSCHYLIIFELLYLYLIETVPSEGESGEITTTYLLLGIWSKKESADHKILSTLGFNDEKAKELAKYVSLKTSLLYH